MAEEKKEKEKNGHMIGIHWKCNWMALEDVSSDKSWALFHYFLIQTKNISLKNISLAF